MVSETSSEKMPAPQPLVSVGIPTYERPDGLKRTLTQILAQKYTNLEVIVSDNASKNLEVQRVAQEFMAIDPRVHYFRQAHNIGALANFKFVLEKASGEYFMWAADDDEWSPEFVQTCVRSSVGTESVASEFETLFRATNFKESNPIPCLDPDARSLDNVKAFLRCVQPSLIYGVHKRKELAYFMAMPSFDFSDCYFVLRQILRSGFRTIPGVHYTAGVDAKNYEIKYTDTALKRFDYSTFLLMSIKLLILTNQLTISEKFDAISELLKMIRTLVKHHEKCENPMRHVIIQIASKPLRSLLLIFGGIA